MEQKDSLKSLWKQTTACSALILGSAYNRSPGPPTDSHSFLIRPDHQRKCDLFYSEIDKYNVDSHNYIYKYIYCFCFQTLPPRTNKETRNHFSQTPTTTLSRSQDLNHVMKAFTNTKIYHATCQSQTIKETGTPIFTHFPESQFTHAVVSSSNKLLACGPSVEGFIELPCQVIRRRIRIPCIERAEESLCAEESGISPIHWDQSHSAWRHGGMTACRHDGMTACRHVGMVACGHFGMKQ